MLLVDKSTDNLKVAELRGDLDEAFTYLVRRRIDFISELSEDEDLIYVYGWEGESEEHFKLKPVAYKTLKSDYQYRDEGGNFFLHLVPDLQTTDRKIWVEIETLRGIKDPLIGLMQKYQQKGVRLNSLKNFG